MRFIAEVFVVEGIKGMFRGAETSRIRTLKVAAWLCFAVSIACFAIAINWPNATVSDGIGIAGMMVVMPTLGFGFWASVEHAKL